MGDHRKQTKKKRLSASISTMVKSLAGQLIIEGAGTFLLVALPTGVATAASLNKAIAGTPADSLGVAVAFGGTLALLVTWFADASGGHFNPAVTIALALTDGFNAFLVPFYVIAQLIGAVLGSLLVALLFIAVPGAHATGYGVTQPGDGFGLVQVLIVEFLGTMLLMITISRVTDPRKDAVSPLTIGLALGVLVLCFGPFSGGAFNPARALGPMLVSGQSDVWYAYVIAELLGALAGAYLYTRKIVAVKAS